MTTNSRTDRTNVDRRTVSYSSLQAIVDDARMLAGESTALVGNWSCGQIFDHLAKSFDISIDGTKNAPAVLRCIMSLFFKKRFLNVAIPPGFKAGSSNLPNDVSTGAGLESLIAAVARLESTSERAMHPGFGRISKDEWNLFHLRHAEVHMSFIVLVKNEVNK